MSSNSRPNASGVGGGAAVAGLLGLTFVFLSALVSFVIVVEYNPLAREFRDTGVSVSPRVISKENLGFTLRYALPADQLGHPNIIESRTVAPLSRYDFQVVAVGEEIDVLVLPRDPRLVWPTQALPSAPRNIYDGIFPLILFLLGLLGIIAGPEVLYNFSETLVGPPNAKTGVDA